MLGLDHAVEIWTRRLTDGGGLDEAVHELLPAEWRARAALSDAEAELVLFAALTVLDGRLAVLCGKRRGEETQAWPTLSLALQLIPGLSLPHVLSGSICQLAGLVAVDEGAALRARLRSPERVWAAVAGYRITDPTLQDVLSMGPLEQVEADPAWPRLADLSERVITLFGAPRGFLAAAAAHMAGTLGAGVQRVRADLLPDKITPIATALLREYVLEGSLPVIDLVDADPASERRAWRLLRALRGRVFVLQRRPRQLGEIPHVPIEVRPPNLHRRIQEWTGSLQRLSMPDHTRRPLARRLSDLFRLPAHAREAAVDVALLAEHPAEAIWTAVAAHAPRPPGRMVRVTHPKPGERQLVVEPDLQTRLDELVHTTRHRSTVMHDWGMSGGRPGGLTALFAGPSGTGKTLAAEVVAARLGLALWHIDLSMVVSKYIGETEKNLGAVFDSADGAGAVLLFDEADSLFAQRSEVGDSRDRYANMEVGFLLQRIEAYGGLAILTTNLEDQLDAAFQRRFHSVLRFGFPSRELRARLWAGVFPDTVPTEGLEVDRLAQLQLTGAGVRAVATRAAFLAAAQATPEGEPMPVTMSLVAEAVRTWMTQQRRPLSPRELEGWT